MSCKTFVCGAFFVKYRNCLLHVKNAVVYWFFFFCCYLFCLDLLVQQQWMNYFLFITLLVDTQAPDMIFAISFLQQTACSDGALLPSTGQMSSTDWTAILCIAQLQHSFNFPVINTQGGFQRGVSYSNFYFSINKPSYQVILGSTNKNEERNTPVEKSTTLTSLYKLGL